MIHSEERIMVWGGYNHSPPSPGLSSQLMRLRTRSKNLFFLSGFFLMYQIYSVVCLVLLYGVWLLNIWCWLAGWSLCKCSGYGCSCGSSEGWAIPVPFHLGRWTWGHQGHHCPHLTADLNLTTRWGGSMGSCVLHGDGGASFSSDSFFPPIWIRNGWPGLNQCLHPSGKAIPREMCKAPGASSS